MSPQSINISQTQRLALTIRQHVLRMTHAAKSSHVGSSLSMADILAVLYSGVMNITPETMDSPLRDRFILSKGHAGAGLYAVLAERGFFPVEWLDTFYKNASPLAGHATSSVPGVEVSTGSLGHGLPIACGLAWGAKRDGLPFRVFAVLSDGECDEGSNWEAALFAPHHCLDNLVVIVDYNKIQSLGSVAEVMNLEPFNDKWTAFGWDVLEVDGHSHEQLRDALLNLPRQTGKPSCIIAHTVKGKGVPFMEHQLLWHYRSPNTEELLAALDALADNNNG